MECLFSTLQKGWNAVGNIKKKKGIIVMPCNLLSVLSCARINKHFDEFS